MVEIKPNYILDIEVLDKRRAQLISTNKEKEAVKRSLNRLQQEVKLVELVTDASTSLKSLLGTVIRFFSSKPNTCQSSSIAQFSLGVKKSIIGR